MFNKKAVTVIVAMSLLLVVAVTGFIFFQNWFYDYESKIFSNVDSSPDSFSSESEIVKVISNSLYFSNAYDELEVESVYLNSVDCNISMNLSVGLQVIPLDSCVGDFSDREVTVEVVTDKYVFSRNIYINELSSKALSSNVESDGTFDCQFLPSGFNDGDGSESNPFEICSCEQLQKIEEDYDANYELVSDIDCLETSEWGGGDGFSPIGNCDEDCVGFSGVLNGNDFTIYDFWINRPSQGNVGFIGVLNGGSVLNLGIESSVVGEWYVGGLVGNMYYGSIDNSYSISTVSGDDGSVGGLVGGIYGYGSIDNSYSISTVSGDSNLGGLIGYIYSSEGSILINNSYSISSVVGDDTVGGFIGYTYNGFIDNSYSISSVVGDDTVGGLIGQIYGYGSIDNSYSVSNITSSSGYSIGGLVGKTYTEESLIGVNNSYSITNIFISAGEGSSKNIGGLVGYMYNTFIDNSYSISDFSGDSASISKVGGLVGYLYYGSSIDNSYSNSEFNFDSGVNNLGGLVGYMNEGSVDNSYSISDFIAAGFDSNVGGLVGYLYSGSVDNSYSVINVSGSEMLGNVGGLVGSIGEGPNTVDNSYWDQDLYATSASGSGLTTSQMKDESNYVDWDFTDVWDQTSYLNGGYPFLKNLFEGSIDCEIGGQEVLNGSSITLYDSKYVTNLGDCNSLERVCEYAVLSGDDSYEYSTCTQNCGFGENEILNGNSFTAYLTQTVPFESTCSSESRTCTNSVVSGSYDYLSCSELPGANCFLEGVFTTHGLSPNLYEYSKMPSGETCSAPVSRTCYDGVFDGDSNYKYLSCNISYVNFNNFVESSSLSSSYDLFVENDLAYVVSYNDNSFTIWNVSNPSNIILLDEYDSSTYLYGASGIDIVNDIAYIVSYNDDSFTTWDISNPSNIIFLDEVDSSLYLDGARDIKVIGNIAYIVSYNDDSFTTWNISNPSNIIRLDEYDSSTYLDGATSMEIVGDIAYVVSYIDDSFTTWNISNPSNIIRMGEYDSSTYLNAVRDIEISGDIAYIVSYYGDSFTTWNISNPSNIIRFDVSHTEAYLNQISSIKIEGDFAYLSSSKGENEYLLTVWNMSDPTNLILLEEVFNPNLDLGKGIDISNNQLYVASYGYLSVFDMYSSDYDGCYLYGDLSKIENSQTKTAYLTSSVPNGGACQNVTRTCNAGVLDGDNNYNYGSCISSPFVGGSGTDENPYQISTCTQLQTIDSNLEKSFILINDIDCSDTINWGAGAGFDPIGDCGEGCNSYEGNFNGNDFSISNLYINRSIWNNVGLFGTLGSNGEIHDLNVHSTVIGNRYVGGVIGAIYGNYVIIDNVYSNGSVTGDQYVGGLIGVSSSCATITSVSSDSVVTGNSAFGDLFGTEWGCE